MGVWVGLISFGCFFELEPVVDLDGGVGGGGTAGAFAGEAGESPLGGDGGDGGDGIAGASAQPDNCGLGEKRCDGVCVTADVEHGCSNDSCAPCADLPNAIETCGGDSGGCRVADCEQGWADCDADTAGYPAQVGNGCEYSFAQSTVILPTAQQPLQVPRGNGIAIGDDSRDDWQGIPAYQMLQTCNTGDCNDDTLPEVIAVAEVPPRRDLDAYFRVAWSPDFFYVLGDVYDDTLLSTGAAIDDGRCQNGALCEDAITVFFDGLNNRAIQGDGYAFDDPRVFLGLGGLAYRVSGSLAPGDVDLKPTRIGAACYRIEAQIAWTLIVGTQPNNVIPGQFPPATGQNYGFDVSVNDWDPSNSDQTPRRESHLFWVNPGPKYHNKTAGFGAMTLVDQVSAAPPPQ